MLRRRDGEQLACKFRSLGYTRRTLEYLLESEEGTKLNNFGQDPT
jgi:hypothetical protein